MSDNRPIGIFDSGLGGLTVANAIKALLPQENLLYVGDTAHLPYGDKSANTIIQYTKPIIQFFQAADCKAIVIACNSASSAATDTIKNMVDESKVKIVDVINPLVDYLGQHYQNKQIALIGTRQTIQSKIYIKLCQARGFNITFIDKATALLVPLVEEGFANKPQLTRAIYDVYFQNSQIANCHAMVLGCTHYPLLAQSISQYFHNSIDIIDAANVTAHSLLNLLKQQNALSDLLINNHHFFITDITDSFSMMASEIFQQPIKIKHLSL